MDEIEFTLEGMSAPELKEWCVTFGYAHSDPQGLLIKSYLKVSAPTELMARIKVHEKVGARWAFIYPAEEFASQIREYELTEVIL